MIKCDLRVSACWRLTPVEQESDESNMSAERAYCSAGINSSSQFVTSHLLFSGEVGPAEESSGTGGRAEGEVNPYECIETKIKGLN